MATASRAGAGSSMGNMQTGTRGLSAGDWIRLQRIRGAKTYATVNLPLASRLYIISRDNNKQLIASPDALKLNLKRYLNSYRMISDAIDVFDAAIINLEIYFQVLVDPSMNKSLLLQSLIRDLKAQFDISNFHIGQPIVINDVISTLFAKPGVITVNSLQFNNIYGTVKNRQYSPITFDVKLNTKNQIIYPPDGAIFEVKFPDINIVGKAVSNA